jgi:type I restriction enzyme, S subunit
VTGRLSDDHANGSTRSGPTSDLPPSWRWAELGDFIVEGPQNGLYLPTSDYGRGTPILRIADFQDGWIQSRDALHLVAASPHEVASFALRVGDIIINRVNSMTHLGKSAVVTPNLAGAIFESNMMRLRVSDELSSEYSVLYLQSGRGRSLLLANAKQAVNQASINQNDVRRTRIAVPPIHEQRAIVSIYHDFSVALDHIGVAVKAAGARARNLRSSILASAFSGKLVTQDPNDEPAAILVERIAADRIASGIGDGTSRHRKRQASRTREHD